jgi:hypothetical protein
MKYIKIFFISMMLLTGISMFWYVDPLHEDIEQMDELVGQNYAFAVETMGENPSPNLYQEYGKFNLEIPKNVKLKDSVLKGFVWDFRNHNIIIWTAKTEKYNDEIIKAIRFKDFVEF